MIASLPYERFEATWRAASSIRRVKVTEVAPFIQAHYLHKRPAVAVLCLVMEVHGVPVGTAIFSLPPRETARRYGGVTWELARLYIIDEVPRNAETWLIARSVKYIRAHHQEVAMLVSYADPAAGHSGTIYRAANWRSDGMTDSERKTPRFDYAHPVMGQRYGRRSHVPSGVVPVRVPRQSKHRFTYRLKG